MRVLIADTYYAAFLHGVYAARPELADAPYAEQHRELMRLRFGVSDAYSHHLGRLGHEGEELVVNCAPLQRAWARERGHRTAVRLLSAGRRRARRLGLLQVALAQAREVRPDVFYVQDMSFFPRPVLRALAQNARLVAGQIASPAPAARVLGGYGLIITSFPHFVDRFRAAGLDAEYLPLAFDARVREALEAEGVDPTPDGGRDIAAGFVGGFDPRVHASGTRLLERACEVVDLAVWGYGMERLPGSSPLHARYRGGAWGMDMYRALARIRIVINRHIDVAEGYANNMRLYEATGVGAMLLTNRGKNLPALFDPAHEVAVYDGEEELLERLEHLVDHDGERRAIAAAGQRRTMRDHTYESRTGELVTILESRL